jgi:hypothetical protein
MVLNEMLKVGADVLAPAMVKLFNRVLESGTFPDSWNSGILHAIYKKGDTEDCNNYRGICITSCLGKVFNSIIVNRLLKLNESKSLISNNQAGFRSTFRTTAEQIYTLRSLISKYVKSGKKKLFYSCFIDFRKAFDTVDRDSSKKE